MEFINRTLGHHINQLMTWFPIVSLTGPRQSGKSTLLQAMFPTANYLNLEDPTLRTFATEDPIGFLKNRTTPLIIDEVQNVPALFSAVQIISDQNGTTGQYILSGSQNFLLMENISQSLAGRVGISHLLPLTYTEATQNKPQTLEEFAHQGGYPRIHKVGIPPEIYYENYIRTYLERDISQLLNIRNIDSFRKMLTICATQAGSLINYTSIANEIDVSFQTIKHWLTILESSFITISLPSYHTNIRKTLTKTPKLYFYDTGLLCHLLDIKTPEDLETSPYKGAIFENLIISETAKSHLHHGKTPKLYFYRDSNKAEIDLLDATSGTLNAYEIKASHTFNDKYIRHLLPISEELGVPAEHRKVIYRGEHENTGSNYSVINGTSYLKGLG